MGAMLCLKSALMVAALTGFGFIFVSALMRDMPLYQRISLSLPWGIMCWGVAWISVVLVFSESRYSIHESITWNLFFLFIVSGILLIFFALVTKVALAPRGFAWIAFVIAMLLLAVYLNLGLVYMTGDSFYLINWNYDIGLTLQEGYPLMLRAIISLSRIIDPDYYLYVIHPLVAISLTYLLFGLLIDKRFIPKRDDFGVLISGAIIIAIFSLNRAYGLQAYYVNHHALVAIGFLSISAIMIGVGRARLSMISMVFIAFATLAISMARMEGFLFVILWLISFAFLLYDRMQRVLLSGIVLVLNTPYIGYLIVNYWDQGFITGKQYLLLWIGLLGSLVMFGSSLVERIYLRRAMGVSILAVLLLMLAIMLMLKPDHMIGNIFAFQVAYSNTWYWGAESHFIVLASILIWVVRLKRKEFFIEHDALFYFFVSSVILNLCITFFRAPLKTDWIDSANRVMFHFIPLILLWIGFEINRRVLSLQRSAIFLRFRNKFSRQ